LLEKIGLVGTKNITIKLRAVLCISCLTQAEGYCIDALMVRFSYTEKPLIVSDTATDDVVFIDWVVDDTIK
jgi:hypothetical protein